MIKNYVMLFFFGININLVNAMEQATQLSHEELSVKLKELAQRISDPKYYRYCGQDVVLRTDSPIALIHLIEYRLKFNPTLALKDVWCADEPIVVTLAANDECHEVLKFTLDHGADAYVDTANIENAALFKALFGRRNNPALKNARLLIQRGAPAKFKRRFYVNHPESHPSIQFLVEFGANYNDFRKPIPAAQVNATK